MASYTSGGNVTTGSKTSGANPFTSPPALNGNWDYRTRTWSGTDGRKNPDLTQKENPYWADISRFTGKANAAGNWLNIGDTVGNVSFHNQWNSNYDNRLNARLLEKLHGHDLHLGIAIGEGNKTLKMIYENLYTIGDAMVDVKRGDFASARRLLGLQRLRNDPTMRLKWELQDARFKSRTLANRWLELQYGWLPLLKDVNEGMKAYAVIANPPRIWEIVATTNTPWQEASVVDSPFKTVRKAKARARGKMKYLMAETLAVNRQLGLYDPEAIAWEIMPWSFVIDWFIPIGTYLQNLNSVPKLSGKFVKSVFSEYHSTAISNKTDPIYYPGTARRERVYLERTVSTGLANAIPRFVGLQDVMSPKRFWNALALVTQRVTR